MKSEILLDIVSNLRSLATSLEAAAATQLMDAEPEPSAPVTKDEAPVTKDEAPSPAKAITLEEIRSVLAEKSMAGFTDEVRGLLEKHGAPKLSQIDPAKYEALLKDIEELN